jgi:hypothetical protein
MFNSEEIRDSMYDLIEAGQIMEGSKFYCSNKEDIDAFLEKVREAQAQITLLSHKLTNPEYWKKP